MISLSFADIKHKTENIRNRKFQNNFLYQKRQCAKATLPVIYIMGYKVRLSSGKIEYPHSVYNQFVLLSESIQQIYFYYSSIEHFTSGMHLQVIK